MDMPIALGDIKGQVVGGNDESAYEVPMTPRGDVNEYTKIGSFAENLTNIRTSGETPKADMVTPETVTAALKKIYIICGVLLTLIVILSVAIGVLTHTLMLRTNALEAKSDETQATLKTLQTISPNSTTQASELSAIGSNQRRITDLESKINDSFNFNANMDLRLNHIEDKLNCTGSQCTVTCGEDIYFCKQCCDGFNQDVDEHWCSSKETANKTVLNSDCKDILQNDIDAKDGVYSVTLNETCERIQVYCDMSTDGGGWTVFQKRVNGSVDFYRKFKDYENGFGSVYGEFWLGLKNIYQMTKGTDSEIRLDVEKSTGEKGFAVYQSFYLSAAPEYTLRMNIGSYYGTAGSPGGIRNNNNHDFSTYDRDVDGSAANCGMLVRGGWWYANCALANLNGEYVTPGTLSAHKNGFGGVIYHDFDGLKSLKSTEMKFRRKD